MFFPMWKLLVLVVGLSLGPEGNDAYRFSGVDSYARFPSWSGCPNASFSFEFRTTRKKEALLLYVDDGGTSDYCVVSIDSTGRVRLEFNTVNENNRTIFLHSTANLNNGKWHRVEVRRRRMETGLGVDGVSTSAISYGSDFSFGSGSNSFVFLGGLRTDCMEFLSSYALPSSCFEHVKPRFSGSIRNVVYNNCSCQLERVAMLDGNNVEVEDEDNVCERSNSLCPVGHICMAINATFFRCDPVNVQCVTSNVTHYVLPMDDIHRQTIENLSGLDAWAFGEPDRREGIIGRAIEIDGRSKYVEVSGPGHRHECFGDLTKCLNGYTVALWVYFEQPGPTDPYVFLSNGGHSSASHGVAMLYGRRVLEVRFRRKDGKEWTVASSEVLPHRWCHIAATWHSDKGVFLYVNGELVGSNSVSRNGSPISESLFNTFIIGRPNDVQSIATVFPFIVDEFVFWSVYKNPEEIREIGPLFRRYASMDSTDDVTGSSLKTRVRGRPEFVPGKIRNALKFTTGQDFLEGNDVIDICLGNLSLCCHGFTISMWIMFNSLQDGTYILSTGNRGIQLYYDKDGLTGEVWDKNRHWKTSWSGARTGRWYFLELSWLQDDWMRLYVDLRPITENDLDEDAVPPESSESTLYVARGGRDLQNMGSFLIDDLEVWYGDREKLVKHKFIQRGAPTHHNISMDAIGNNQVVHPSLHIKLFGQPVITKGRINGALSLDGVDDYAFIEGQSSNCFVNLDFCRHGLLLSSWLKLDRLRDGMGILSTGNNGLQVEYIGGQLVVQAQTTIREWRVGTNAVRTNVWVFFEILWDPYSGLALMMDNERVAQNRTSVVRSDWVNETFEQFYIGNGSLTLDDFEFWYGNRVFLMAFGYLSRGRPRDYLIYMDLIRNGRIPHRDLNITVFGNPTIVPGKINSAIQLDGKSQYIDLGDHSLHCLGNLELCNNGFTGSIFLNFRAFHENVSCLSSGGGVDLFMAGGRLVVLLHELRTQWKIVTEALDKDRWYFVEFTWHRAKGLRVFVDNKLIGQQTSAVRVSHYPAEEHFLIGTRGLRGGPSSFANILVDDAQFWYGDREELIAFEYILRDSVTYVAFSMERTVGDRVFHPDYVMTLHNGAKLVPGRVGNSASLQGSGQFLALGDQKSSCLGNLEMCKNGLTIGFFLNPVQLTTDSYLISSGSYEVFFRNGKLWTKFSMKTKTWELSTDQVFARVWQRIDISWDAWRGQQIYINNSLVNSTDSYTDEHSTEAVSDYSLYIGRPSEGIAGGRYYARATFDELEFWFAHREHLKGFDVVTDEIQRLLVDMDSIVRDTITHPTIHISVHGSPVVTNGIIGNAVWLNGVGQFIQFDGGDGDLSNYHRGFTLRFKVKPYQLMDNMYWISNSDFDIFYRNSRVIVQVRTTSGLWEASLSGIKEGMWHQIEVSWHRIDGLTLYVNSSVAEQLSSVKYDGVYNGSQNFYIGKAFTETSLARYANASFDDFQFWKAKRDYLIPDMIDPAYDMALIGVANKVSKMIFPGTSWLHYNFSQMKDFSRWRNVSLQSLRLTLETRNRDGVIWFTETSDHYITFGIESGKLYLTSHAKVGNYSEKSVFDMDILINTSYELVLSQKSDGKVELVINNQRFSKTFAQKFHYINPFSFYIGGISRPAESQFVRKNFHGTVSEAVLFDNGHSQTVNLVLAALGKLSYVSREDMIKFCATAVCQNGGICKEDFCDCNLTSYVGQLCTEEAEGYQFGVRGGGAAVFDLAYRQSTEFSNEIALGFMTWSKNGTLLRQSSRNGSAHYFSIALVNGFVTIHYDVGKGVSVMGGKVGKYVSDGAYHHLFLSCNGSGYVVLQVDNAPVQLYTMAVSDLSIFGQMDRIELGAKKLAEQFFFARLYGIISGVYVNGRRIIDVALSEGEGGGIHVDTFGDTVIANHPFQVQEAINMDSGNPSFERQVGLLGYSALEEGGRAAGISGAMLGLLMVASSLMWALYRLKPGVLGGDKWELQSDPNITAPLYSGRKSVSDAGAADLKASTTTAEFDSGYTNMAGVNAESANRTNLNLIMSPVPSSHFQDSAGLVAEMKSGSDMTKAGMHQEASHLMVVSGGNASVNMDSSFGASSGRGQAGAQAMTSSHQQSVTVVREFHSSAGTSHSQEMSQFSKTGQMASGGKLVGLNAGGMVASSGGSRNISQNVSQVSALKTNAGTSEKSGAVMIFSNFGGNAAKNQENSNMSLSSRQVMSGTGEWNGVGVVGTSEASGALTSGRTMLSETTVHSVVHKTTVGAVVGQDALQASQTSLKFSSNNLDLGNTEENSGTVVIYSNVGGASGKSRDKSQVDVAFHKATGRAVVDGATAFNAERTETSRNLIQQSTSAEYSIGQTSSLGHRSSAAGVDVSKYDLTRTSLKATAASGPDASIIKESERSEELLMTSGTRTFTSRTLSPSALSEIKSTTSSENRNLLGDRKGATTLRVQPSTQMFSAEYSASSLESEFIAKGLSLDRSVASVKGDPPRTVKVQSPVKNTALPVLLITTQDTSSGSGSARVHASLERSSSLVRGQPPKTIKVESPVSPPVAGLSPSSLLNAPSLDRSSSFMKGELPRKLKIESPGRQGGTAFHGSTSSSPNVVNVSDASFQKSSFFSTHSALSSFKPEGFSGVHSSDGFNIQLPDSLQTTRRYQIQNMSLMGGVRLDNFPPAFEAPRFSGSTETAHVECILLTADGQYVVSGSVSGPPQVWNMETGEHAKKMEGENLRSTDLHLANNDALLIGRVIKAEQGAISEPKSLSLGKLQIWDFGSGKPLKMQKNETFTASFLMLDGGHIALGRTETDSPGKLSVIIVIWDILANQPKRKIAYQVGKMTADQLTYVNQSSDRRFLVAGFKNNETENATYLTFDLAASNFDVVKPAVTELEADVKNTVIIRDQEAVTGTRVGGLVFWSLKTGKLSGQLVAPPGEVGSSRAHRMEPRDLVVSKDGRYLVSASADKTLCLWNLDTKLHVRTFTGHTDEVTCCAISNDNELLVSGSRDKSIRLWHLGDGAPVTSIHADAAIVRVLLSNDKQTVAALAEQNGKRRLVMMRVVRTKVRKSTTSHEES